MSAAHMMDPDAVLMVNVREGDSASFELLLHRHRSSVINHLYRLTRDRSVAEELAQDVFVRIYRSRSRYQPEAKFTTWLFRITTNVALNCSVGALKSLLFRAYETLRRRLAHFAPTIVGVG